MPTDPTLSDPTLYRAGYCRLCLAPIWMQDLELLCALARAEGREALEWSLPRWACEHEPTDPMDESVGRWFTQAEIDTA